MYDIFATKRYTKSIARLRQDKSWNEENVRVLLRLLMRGDPLPAKYEDHQLRGSMSAYRESHIKHDLLLTYVRNETKKTIMLSNIGTHDDLFGK